MNYSRDHMEAACCIWEAMLELRRKNDALDRAFLRQGASAMRLRAVDLADQCHEEWDMLSCDDKNEIVFDWEFVPSFVNAIDWNSDYSALTPAKRGDQAP